MPTGQVIAIQPDVHGLPDLLRQVPTTISVPGWLKKSSVAVEGDYGRTTIPAAMAPTVDQRELLKALLSQANERLKPGPIGESAAQVSDLIMAFPMGLPRDPDERKMVIQSKSRAFLTATEDLPAWAVERACRSWLKAEGGEGTENYAFPPSPPQVVRLAKHHMSELLMLRYHVTRVLRAEVQRERHSSEFVDSQKLQDWAACIGVEVSDAAHPERAKSWEKGE